MTALAPAIESFFTDYLIAQRGASPHTIASYRDTFRLLFAWIREQSGTRPSDLDFADVDAATVSGFLAMLADERHNTSRTRSQRLATIHSLFRRAALGYPEHAALIARVLAIQPRKPSRKTVAWLTEDEADPLQRSAITGLRQWQRENPGAPGGFVFTARGTARKMSTDAVATRIKIHAATAAAACPRVAAKNVTPHVLRHSFAMRLQSSGAGGPSIALLLGHESLSSTRPYLHADLELKQKALDRTAPPQTRRGRYTPPDKLLAFLESLP